MPRAATKVKTRTATELDIKSYGTAQEVELRQTSRPGNATKLKTINLTVLKISNRGIFQDYANTDAELPKMKKNDECLKRLAVGQVD